MPTNLCDYVLYGGSLFFLLLICLDIGQAHYVISNYVILGRPADRLALKKYQAMLGRLQRHENFWLGFTSCLTLLSFYRGDCGLIPTLCVLLMYRIKHWYFNRRIDQIETLQQMYSQGGD